MTDRVLIVKLVALGDAIMASTLVPAIRARAPGAHITWVAGASVAPLVRLMHGVDRVIEVNETALLGGNRMAAVAAAAGAMYHIGRGYDRALVAHTDRRYALLTLLAGARHTHRFADERAPRAGWWHGAEYVRLLDDPTALSAAPPFPAIDARGLPAAPDIAGSGPLVLVAPGGGRNALRDDPLRRWPLPSWTTVVRALVQHGHRVVAIGGARDATEGAACAAAGAVDLTGRTSLLELAALVKAADVVVTHDAGPLHLSLLFNRPTVALFGPTPPSERVPVGAPVTVLSRAATLPCAPCYDGFRYAECSLNLCLTRVPALEVVRAVEDRLAVALTT